MDRTITPFLLFGGKAEEAMHFYVGLFPRPEVVSVERYGPGEPGAEGSVKRADFVVADQPEAAFHQLSQDGRVLMPPDNYGFSRRFGWTDDRYGVSWQLNLQ